MAIYDEHFGGYRIFVGDLGRTATRYDVETEFGSYGQLLDVWVARNPPGFAFLVFKDKYDCERAVRKCHGRRVCGRRVRVEFARPFDDRAPGNGLRGGATSKGLSRSSHTTHDRSFRRRSRSPRRRRSRSRDRGYRYERRHRSQTPDEQHFSKHSRDRSRSHSSSPEHEEDRYTQCSETRESSSPRRESSPTQGEVC